jgi:hypothetical protein
LFHGQKCGDGLRWRREIGAHRCQACRNELQYTRISARYLKTALIGIVSIRRDDLKTECLSPFKHSTKLIGRDEKAAALNGYS